MENSSIHIQAVPPNLKTNGTSNVWVYGTDLRKGDLVRIENSVEAWEGEIVSPQGPANCARAHLTYQGGGPPYAGDLLSLNVTITRGTLKSNVYSGEFVKNGP